jgi:pilus assembly protein CpaB
MRLNTVMMLVLAAVFGVSAVLVANRWLSRQADLQRQQVVQPVQQPEVPTTTIVVAALPLRYGMELSSQHLREVSWPSATLPPGSFASAAELLAGNGRRIVLSAIEPNEPVLQTKVTGPGQRGTLSALIQEGMGAVTVQVNEVLGVAGFVLPGDRVDLLVTRRMGGGGDGPSPTAPTAFSDVVLRNVRVLASGQTADDRSDKPSIVNAVTLEVDSIGAQKVALAATAGSLSLMLRKAGETASAAGRRVSLSEVGQDGLAGQTVVRVTRATERKEYSVPMTPLDGGGNLRQVATAH